MSGYAPAAGLVAIGIGITLMGFVSGGLLLLAGLTSGPLLVGVGIMIFAMSFFKDGVAWKIITGSHDSPLVFSETRDGENMFVDEVEDSTGGVYMTEDAFCLATEQGVDNLAGIPVMLTTEDAGVGIPLKFAAYCQWLKQQKDIHDGDELEERIVEEAKKQQAFNQDKLAELKLDNIDVSRYNAGKPLDEIDIGDVKWSEADVTIDDVDLEKLEGFDMEIPVGDYDAKPAVRLQDFRRFMKQNINPAILRAKMKKMEAKLKEQYQGFSLDAETGLSILFILLGITMVAYVLMGGGMGI